MRKFAFIFMSLCVLGCTNSDMNVNPLIKGSVSNIAPPESSLRVADDEWFDKYKELLTTKNIFFQFVQSGVLSHDELIQLDSLNNIGSLKIDDIFNFLNSHERQLLEGYFVEVNEHFVNVSFGDNYIQQFENVHNDIINDWGTQAIYAPGCEEAAAQAAISTLAGCIVEGGVVGLMAGGVGVGLGLVGGVISGTIISTIVWGIAIYNC